MTFQTKDLSVLAYANRFTLWHYTTEDSGFPGGYFNEAHTMLRAGDIILVNFKRDGPRAAMLLVAAAQDGAVIIAWLTSPPL